MRSVEPDEAAWYQRWVELRAAAMTFAGHGWPVLRGTYPATHDGCQPQWRGRSGTVGLRPIDHDWPAARTVGSAQVARWWHAQPYSLLIATGHDVDCVEIPELFTRRALDALASLGVHPPTMLTPRGTVALFVRTPKRPAPALPSARLRSTNDWMPLPPTRQDSSPTPDDRGYRWLTAPGEVEWLLPELTEIAPAITKAVRS